MPEIGIFGLGVQSKSLNVSNQERVNLYYEVTKDQDKAKVIAYGTPGSVLFSSIGANPARGMHWVDSVKKLYVIVRTSLYEVTISGTATFKASLATSPVIDDAGKVSMANNGTELAIFTGVNGYIYNVNTGVISTITLPFAGSAGTTVTFLDGRFITERPNTGQFYISALYNGLSWLGSGGLGDFATAESYPDNLQYVIADKGYLALIGNASTELWVNTGDVLFPFQRVNGAPSESGLAAKWSLSKMRNNLVGLIQNRQGAMTIGVLNGYQWESISTPDLDYAINNYSTPTDAVGFSYTMNGRNFYVITFQADQASWIYDQSSGGWSKLKSWLIPRYIGDLGAAIEGDFIISDYSTGNLYKLDANALTDNGNPIERELIGKHIFRPSRNMMTIRRLRVDMEGGVGLITGQGSDPQIMLQISRDYGHTFGRELWTRIGNLGDYAHRAEWRRIGQGRDFVFKLRITDPVKVAIIAAVIEAQELNK